MQERSAQFQLTCEDCGATDTATESHIYVINGQRVALPRCVDRASCEARQEARR